MFKQIVLSDWNVNARQNNVATFIIFNIHQNKLIFISFSHQVLRSPIGQAAILIKKSPFIFHINFLDYKRALYFKPRFLNNIIFIILFITNNALKLR
jgi:hypothetical protein